MNKEYSLYLDLLRFFAAITVFFAHVSSQGLTSGLFWQFKPYAQSAVILFFIMSGYVISYVTDHKEKNIKIYAIARVSRLYSIVIPALLITLLCDFIGREFNNGLYVNGPFWSLTYEFFYYIIFAVIYFVKGNVKWLLLSIAAIAAGPSIISLLPVWYAGFWLYKIQKNPFQLKVNKNLQVIFSIVSVLAIIYLSPVVREIKIDTSSILRAEILGDYFDAIFFFFHLYFVPKLLSKFKLFIFKFENIIRWFGSLTFALYLFHRPIIQMNAAIFKDSLGILEYSLVMYLGTFLIIVTLGRWCEKQKITLKYAIEKIVHK